jgi:cytochrome c
VGESVRGWWGHWPRGASEAPVAALLPALLLLGLAATTATLAACGGGGSASAIPPAAGGRFGPREVPGGDASRGQRAISAYGCGACHVVPGVAGARGLVGPPLISFAYRSYVAGSLPNTPANLVRFLQTPQAIRPGSAMPNLDVVEADARDIAAYLYSLE